MHYLVIGSRIVLNLLAEVDMVFEQRALLLGKLRLAMRVELFEVGFVCIGDIVVRVVFDVVVSFHYAMYADCVE